MSMRCAVSLLVAACVLSAPSIAAAEIIALGPAASTIKWTGKKVTGQHHGTVQLKRGQVTVENGRITGGKVDVAMATIVDEDLTDPNWNTKLVTHLKSPDFFNAAQYPVATFVLKRVTALPAGRAATHEIAGDLTIKGITHEVSFPATVTLGDGKAEAKGTLAVDRTQWDIRYGSGKFFENLGDKMIDDTFTLDLDLRGTS